MVLETHSDVEAMVVCAWYVFVECVTDHVERACACVRLRTCICVCVPSVPLLSFSVSMCVRMCVNGLCNDSQCDCRWLRRGLL